MTQIAHRHGAKVMVDGAQSISHIKVDVQAIDCDFFVFSGHKTFGPTGIGAVYAKQDILNAMQPYQGGGNMIADVTFERTVYQAPPNKFEAGTGNIADAVGLGAAIDYVSSLGIESISRYEHFLLEYGMEAPAAYIGTAAYRYSQRKDQCPVLCPGWILHGGNRPGPKSGRHCRAGGTSLRPAHPASFWPGKHSSPVHRLLQYHRGNRCAGIGNPAAAQQSKLLTANTPTLQGRHRSFRCLPCGLFRQSIALNTTGGEIFGPGTAITN